MNHLFIKLGTAAGSATVLFLGEFIEEFQSILGRLGLHEFRNGQREIISSILEGKDVMAVLPTGGGKSLCFQFPALLKKQLVIVVSPLIALMKDQVAGLKARGVAADCLHSGQSPEEKRQVFRALAQGGEFLLYLSPERIQKDGFKRWITDQKLGLFAIDEAHCVSQWGHDFRPEYSELKVLKELCPEIPVLALTASATPLVLNDISRTLGLRSPARHVHGFYRPNLYYQVETCADEALKFASLAKALRQFPDGRIIVYCGTRRGTEEVSEKLANEFPGVGCYHAGMGGSARTQIQTRFKEGGIRILVATNAFGMGIDHPDVRLVVHFNLPANIDSLYQEMGRAGRDGMESTCLLLYSPKDKGLQAYFIQSSESPKRIKQSRWNTLNALIDYAEAGECRHSEILSYYHDSQRLVRCGHCDVCAPNSPRRIQSPPAEDIPRSTRSRKKAAKAVATDELDQQSLLWFELLREWRRKKAKELDVAAFMVFSDRTLRELAKTRPDSLSSMADINGFGEKKLQAFGSDILRVFEEGLHDG